MNSLAGTPQPQLRWGQLASTRPQPHWHITRPPTADRVSSPVAAGAAAGAGSRNSKATRTANSDWREPLYLMKPRLPFVTGGQSPLLPGIRPHGDQRTQRHNKTACPEPVDKGIDVHLHLYLFPFPRILEQGNVNVPPQGGVSIHSRPGLIFEEVELSDWTDHSQGLSILRQTELRRAHPLFRRIIRREILVRELIFPHRNGIPRSQRLLNLLLESVGTRHTDQDQHDAQVHSISPISALVTPGQRCQRAQ